MKFTELKFDGLYLIEPIVHDDNRGFFLEWYQRDKFARAGIDAEFVQDNHSMSRAQGTIRGMHFQMNPRAQSKLIRVVRGKVMNVVVDIRLGSPHYGQWQSVELSSDNKAMLFVPKGFANGYVSLSPDVEIVYKVDDYYAPDCDRAFRWDDPSVAIDWPVTQPVLSDRDRAAPLLEAVENNFRYEGS